MSERRKMKNRYRRFPMITDIGYYEKMASSLKYCLKNHHIFIYGCGLCATGVPCESRNPAAEPVSGLA